MSGDRVRIFLVDDHHLFRSGVRAELGNEADVVGEASEVEAAIEMIGERAPEVVLVDVHMSDGGGEAVIRGVLVEHPDVRFLALSVSDAPEDVIAVIRAGARGYVTKTISGPSSSTPSAGSPMTMVFTAVRSCARRSRRCRSMPSIPISTSSPRANARCCVISRGTYKETGRQLNISTKTVETTCRRSCASSNLESLRAPRWATEPASSSSSPERAIPMRRRARGR